MRAALPANYDDDDGSTAGWITAGLRDRNGIGVAQTTRPDNRRRADRKPGANAIYDACGLSLYGQVALARTQTERVPGTGVASREPRGLTFFLRSDVAAEQAKVATSITHTKVSLHQSLAGV